MRSPPIGITVPKRENCTRLAESPIKQAFQRYLFSLTRKGRNLSKLVACNKIPHINSLWVLIISKAVFYCELMLLVMTKRRFPVISTCQMYHSTCIFLAVLLVAGSNYFWVRSLLTHPLRCACPAVPLASAGFLTAIP